MYRRSPNARRLLIAWTAFFALNAGLSAAFCMSFRAGPHGAGGGGAMAMAPAPTPAAHDAADPTPPSRHRGHEHHEHGTASDGDCEFHLLSGLADTAVALTLSPPPRTGARPGLSPPATPHTALTRHYPIRAPPVS